MRSGATSTARSPSRARRSCSTRLVRDGRVLRSYKDGRARIAGYLEDHAALGLAAIARVRADVRRTLARSRARDERRDRALVLGRRDRRVLRHRDAIMKRSSLVRATSRQRDAVGDVARGRAARATRRAARTTTTRGARDVRGRDARAGDGALPDGVRAHARVGGHAGATARSRWRSSAIRRAAISRRSSGRAAERYVPSLVIAGGADGGRVALLAGRTARDGRATAYVCRNYACDEPATRARAPRRATRGSL